MKHLLFLLLLATVAKVAGAVDCKPEKEARSMTESKAEIAAVINAWTFYRDQERWSELASTFHDNGTISISWFNGPHTAFVAASQKLSANGNNVVKHHVGVPMIQVQGARALSEVNVTIMVRSKIELGEIDTTSYARFYDQLELRDGQWKITRRTAIYEKDRLDPVTTPVLPEPVFTGLEQFPAEVKFLAATLKKVGAELSKSIVLDKSPQMAQLYADGQQWLNGK